MNSEPPLARTAIRRSKFHTVPTSGSLQRGICTKIAIAASHFYPVQWETPNKRILSLFSEDGASRTVIGHGLERSTQSHPNRHHSGDPFNNLRHATRNTTFAQVAAQTPGQAKTAWPQPLPPSAGFGPSKFFAAPETPPLHSCPAGPSAPLWRVR